MTQVVITACPLDLGNDDPLYWKAASEKLRAHLTGLSARVHFDQDGNHTCRFILVCSYECSEQATAAMRSAIGPARVYLTELWGECEHLPMPLEDFVVCMRRESRIVVGESAVERMLQRRKVSLLIVASDLDAEYKGILSRIINNSLLDIPVYMPALTREALGKCVGVHKASVVGVLKAPSVITLGE